MSTSTTTSTTVSGLHPEMVENVFGGPTCPVISAQPGAAIRWDSTPVPAGADKWQLVFVASDSVDNRTLVARFISNDGNHSLVMERYGSNGLYGNTSTYFKSASATFPTMDNIVAPHPDDLGLGENTNFYVTPTLFQFEWYAPNPGTFVAFAANFGTPTPTRVTNLAVFIAPLSSGQPIQFKAPFSLGYIQVGQGIETGAVPLSAGLTSPCETTAAQHFEAVPLANMCENATVSNGPIPTADETMNLE